MKFSYGVCDAEREKCAKNNCKYCWASKQLENYHFHLRNVLRRSVFPRIGLDFLLKPWWFSERDEKNVINYEIQVLFIFTLKINVAIILHCCKPSPILGTSDFLREIFKMINLFFWLNSIYTGVFDLLFFRLQRWKKAPLANFTLYCWLRNNFFRDDYGACISIIPLSQFSRRSYVCIEPFNIAVYWNYSIKWKSLRSNYVDILKYFYLLIV